MKETALIISNSKTGKLISNSDIIKMANVELVKCCSISEAINILKSQGSVDIIISNYSFHDSKFSTIIQYLNNNNIYIPIITVLNENEVDMRTQAYIDGASVVFTQPISESYLLLSVNNLLKLTYSSSKLKISESVINSLSKTLEFRDEYTQGHAKRVAVLAKMLHEELGLTDIDERYKLYLGSLLHDVGKIGIPDFILKSNKIFDKTSREFEEMKKHPLLGYEIASDINDGVILEIILNHHEKLDGSGYPRGLKAKDISILSRIVAIIDIFDSLIHKRSYRDPMSIEQAFETMEEEAKEGKISYDIFNVFRNMILVKGFTIDSLKKIV